MRREPFLLDGLHEAGTHTKHAQEEAPEHRLRSEHHQRQAPYRVPESCGDLEGARSCPSH